LGGLVKAAAWAAFVTKGPFSGAGVAIRAKSTGTISPISAVTVTPFTVAAFTATTKTGLATGAVIITTIASGGKLTLSLGLGGQAQAKFNAAGARGRHQGNRGMFRRHGPQNDDFGFVFRWIHRHRQIKINGRQGILAAKKGGFVRLGRAIPSHGFNGIANIFNGLGNKIF
jgi:hypothetical protein